MRIANTPARKSLKNALFMVYSTYEMAGEGLCHHALFAIKGNMRIFKTKSFTRLADKEGITDPELLAAADEVNRGEYEVDLGGGVFKKRIARAGSGKAGGYRAILFFRKNERLFFAYVLPSPTGQT